MWFAFKYFLFCTFCVASSFAFAIWSNMHGLPFDPITLMFMVGAAAIVGVCWVIYFFILILIILVRTTNDVDNHFKNQKQTTRK